MLLEVKLQVAPDQPSRGGGGGGEATPSSSALRAVLMRATGRCPDESRGTRSTCPAEKSPVSMPASTGTVRSDHCGPELGGCFLPPVSSAAVEPKTMHLFPGWLSSKHTQLRTDFNYWGFFFKFFKNNLNKFLLFRRDKFKLNSFRDKSAVFSLVLILFMWPV